MKTLRKRLHTLMADLKNMGLVRSVFLASAMMLVTGMGAFAQSVPLTGKVVSSSVTYTPSSGSESAVVYVVPATGSFVLTQFCSNGICEQNGEMLSDNLFGFIAALPETTVGTYQTVFPLGGVHDVQPRFRITQKLKSYLHRRIEGLGLDCANFLFHFGRA